MPRRWRRDRPLGPLARLSGAPRLPAPRPDRQSPDSPLPTADRDRLLLPVCARIAARLRFLNARPALRGSVPATTDSMLSGTAGLTSDAPPQKSAEPALRFSVAFRSSRLCFRGPDQLESDKVAPYPLFT